MPHADEPYRAAGREFIALLKTLGWVSIVEKASIDEAYLLYRGAQQNGAAPGAQLAQQLATEVRARSEPPVLV